MMLDGAGYSCNQFAHSVVAEALGQGLQSGFREEREAAVTAD